MPPTDYTAEGNFDGIALVNGEEGVTVEINRLDELFDGPRLRLIKIDVEGVETDVITGGKSIIKTYQPILYVENDRVGQSKQLIELIFGLDYKIWWHIPPLFNPENYFANQENKFGPLVSINMLCVHRSVTAELAGLKEVTDSSFHPQGN